MKSKSSWSRLFIFIILMLMLMFLVLASNSQAASLGAVENPLLFSGTFIAASIVGV